MTNDGVLSELAYRRHDLVADSADLARTAAGEDTPANFLGSTGHRPAEHNSGRSGIRIRLGRGGKQSVGVGVKGRREDLVGRAVFDDLAQIHHRYPVRHVPHQRQIMRNDGETDMRLLQNVA